MQFDIDLVLRIMLRTDTNKATEKKAKLQIGIQTTDGTQMG